MVQCGQMCWLFPRLREAQNLLWLLWSQGLSPRYEAGLSARQVASLVAKLPAGMVVEDCRLTQWRWPSE